jgi:hypothetical protein
MVRAYTTRDEKEDLLYDKIQSVCNCIDRDTPDRRLFHVEQTFKDNMNLARAAGTGDVHDQLNFARSAMQYWNRTSNTQGVGNIIRRLVLDVRVDALSSILDNWDDDNPWLMQNGQLSFPFLGTDQNPPSQHPTPSNPATAGGAGHGAENPGPALSQMNHMLLQLKQLI